MLLLCTIGVSGVALTLDIDMVIRCCAILCLTCAFPHVSSIKWLTFGHALLVFIISSSGHLDDEFRSMVLGSAKASKELIC